MITSIEFPKEGEGYIYKKPEKPIKPNKRSRDYYKFDWDNHKDIFNEGKYQKDLKQYEDELKFYSDHKGQFILPCSKNLIGKTFKFKEGINLLFGPNASGKSTIIKAIAGRSLCTDGYSSLITPQTTRRWNSFEGEFTYDNYINEIKLMQGNTCTVNWTGNPVYFDNFSNRQTHGEFGNLIGSALESLDEELTWIIRGNKISKGQQTIWLLNKVLRKLDNGNISLRDRVEPQLKKMLSSNDLWHTFGIVNQDYLNILPDYDKAVPMTLLFDEMDKSLDYETVVHLYKDVLPSLVEKYKIQIIIVSHHPVFLTKFFRKNKSYNIIDIDSEYTIDCLKLHEELC